MKIVIEGKELVLVQLPKSEVKKRVKLPDVWIHYAIYQTAFLGNQLLILEQTVPNSFTPLRLKYLADVVAQAYDLPVVFYYEKMDFYQRRRLIDRGVYFIIGNNYVFLPMLLINSKMVDHKPNVKLSSVAQWLLLYHLQVADLNGKTARELENETPYLYTTLTRAFKVLEELSLCRIEQDEKRYKHICFQEEKRALYEAAVPYMINPVDGVMFSDSIEKDILFPKAGINALSHYSMLNDEEMQTYALTDAQIKEHLPSFVGWNPIEGNFRLEKWIYPPITKDGYVDKISLALSLQDDHDPRVEKEVKQMIEDYVNRI